MGSYGDTSEEVSPRLFGRTSGERKKGSSFPQGRGARLRGKGKRSIFAQILNCVQD